MTAMSQEDKQLTGIDYNVVKGRKLRSEEKTTQVTVCLDRKPF